MPSAREPIDERHPLLGANAEWVDAERRRTSTSQDPLGSAIADLPAHDPSNPLDWTPTFKWSIVFLLALMSFTVTFTCVSLVPLATRIAHDLDPPSTLNGTTSKSSSSAALLVTIWELGEAGGPLFIAPLSEVFGRYPVMNVANVAFVAFTALAALCTSIEPFVAARCLTGLAVASNVLNPAIIGDMFPSERRGTAMSAVMFAPLLGGAVGPAIGGAIAETAGWRTVLWMSAAIAAACEVMFLFFFRETYRAVILRKRAVGLRAEAAAGLDDAALTEALSESRAQDWANLRESILRPAEVLFGSGVLLSLSWFGSIVFAYFYVLAVSLPTILEDIYGLSPALQGSGFMCFSVGSFFSVVICNLTLDRIYIRLRDAAKGAGQPEFRLPLVIAGGLTMPFAIAAYGWSAQLRLPVAVVLLTVVTLGLTLILAFIPLMAYVVDAFGLYSASAMTGLIVTRCLMGTFLPLATGPIADAFGYGWGFTWLGLFSLAMAPIPVLVMRYGPVWRQRSKYTKDQ